MRTVALSNARLEELLHAVARVRAAVVGDVCLDAYWIADMRKSALSRETPHHNLPVVRESYALGGAGNVVKNMRRLGASVTPVTLLGEDWRGTIVRSLARELELAPEGFIVEAGRVTPAYVKPYRTGYGGVQYEDPRIDFENARPPAPEAEARLIAALNACARSVDVIAVSDQLANGAITARVREALLALARAGKTVLVDSRENIVRFPGCLVKPNELEAARATGLSPAAVTAADYLPVAQKLREITGSCVIVTLGAAGALCLDAAGEPRYAPGVAVPPPIDIVGAGDSFLSACALALGAGATPDEAAALGNLASAVTIRKIGETGTASAEEIRTQMPKQE